MKKKKLPLALGLMSGTSMDAIDAALVHIGPSKDTLLLHTSVPYPSALKKRLMVLLSSYQAPMNELALLHRDVGQAFAAVAERCLHEAERKKICKASDVQIVGSHGQTIFHSPHDHTTWQIGEPTWISARLGLPVVSDFRMADMACDGEGAPLLPWYHRRLFARQRAVAIHNLGGISNFTYLGEKNKIWGCDTGPANCWIDSATFQLFGKAFDGGGKLAAQGRIQHTLLRSIRSDSKISRFLNQPPPKSTGRELFSEEKLKGILNQAQKAGYSAADTLATITEFTAVTISDAYSQWVLQKKLPLEEIIFCGGGSNNQYLLGRIRQNLPKIKVSRLEDHGFSSSALEAQAFAVYAWMWKKNIPINCPSVTGARWPVICGKLTPAILAP